VDKLYIVIPAYNEEANIDEVIKSWYPIVEKVGNGSKLVIIDDGSKDSTYQIMKKHAQDLEGFEPITKPNGGHGATVLYGYHYALNAGADYIFQTDSDDRPYRKNSGRSGSREKSMIWLSVTEKAVKTGFPASS
jgi:glycosyltransferase involved in cell wall biosynthesis